MKRGDTEFNINGGKCMQITKNNSLIPSNHKGVTGMTDAVKNAMQNASPDTVVRVVGGVVITIIGTVGGIICKAIDKHYTVESKLVY